jgi:ubiquitin-protein ligase
MRTSPRDRRLAADYRSIAQLLAESTILRADARGNPPQQYRFRFQGWGVGLNPAGDIIPCDHHEVIVELGAAYPRMMPTLTWKTPIFHPNISANGVVCLGGYGTHWVPSLTLSELCTMLWDIIRYKNFNIDSPYNREAAEWARTQTAYQFPLDPRPLRDAVGQFGTLDSPAEKPLAAGEPSNTTPAAPPPLPPQPPPDIVFLD